MEISTETKNKAMLLTQSKKILDEKGHEFFRDVYNMYEQFLRESGLDKKVIYDGKVVGRLKLVCNYKTLLFNKCHVIRFCPAKPSKARAWNVIGVGNDDFVKNCQHILKLFQPYKGEQKREHEREHEMERSAPKKKEREY